MLSKVCQDSMFGLLLLMLFFINSRHDKHYLFRIVCVWCFEIKPQVSELTSLTTLAYYYPIIFHYLIHDLSAYILMSLNDRVWNRVGLLIKGVWACFYWTASEEGTVPRVWEGDRVIKGVRRILEKMGKWDGTKTRGLN